MATPLSISETTSSQIAPPVSHPPQINSFANLIALQNVHHHISKKIKQDNYILWRFLMVPFLEGQNLFGYVDGTHPRPPQLLPDPTSGLLLSNLEYQSWYHQDKMIFGAIIYTLSVEALPHVIGLSTSQEVWLTLETMFSTQSQSRIMQLKQ